jgi:hypothetical protein
VAHRKLPVAFFNHGSKVTYDLIGNLLRFRSFSCGVGLTADLRQGEEVIDEQPHPVAGIYDLLEKLPTFRIHLAGVMTYQD